MNLHNHIDLLGRFERGIHLKESIFDTVKDSDRVLDAGCGTGLLSIWAAQAGAREVISVDTADLSVAKKLANDNGVADKIQFIQSDLNTFKFEDDKKADVLISMLYFNDPRRDENQVKLCYDLRKRFLQEKGTQIPGKVEYTAFLLDWREQDIGTMIAERLLRINTMEETYRLNFEELKKFAQTNPDPRWFPKRSDYGRIVRNSALVLSDEVCFEGAHYADTIPRYPDTLTFALVNSGKVTAILFIQKLIFNNRLLFSNESISWVVNPKHIEAGTAVHVNLDDQWRQKSLISLF